jgi:hypothetical protein
MSIESLVGELSHDPFNPELNFACAQEYQALNQSASAVSFYLRAAEYGHEKHLLITYTSLIKVAQCFEFMNDRQVTVSNCLLQAIAYLPQRAEAYFFMSQFHEKNQQWQEAYTFASLGLGALDSPALPADVGYHGKYCLEFQQAVSAWWIGRAEESINLLRKLDNMELHPVFANAVKYNLERLNAIS